MGQIFNACIYDVESMTCCQIDADKFHANCYSYSGAVASAHYLLRQKPYRVMWGGRYVLSDDAIEGFSRTEDLLGLSTFLDYDSIKDNTDDLEEQPWFNKAKFIGDNNSRWKRIDVWEEALEYFNWKSTHSVKYSGYLLNHTQKLAVSMEDYFCQSIFLMKDGEIAAIDLIPVLTETGGGTPMALYKGAAANSTEELSTTWCGDLLQIVDELPGDYKLIDCCFVDMWQKANFCYRLFGVDESNYVLSSRDGKRYECVVFDSIDFKRGQPRYVKVELTDNEIKYTAEVNN